MCEYPGPEAKVGANRASCCGQRMQSERVLSKDGGQKFAFDAFPNFVCRGKYMQTARILSLSASFSVCPCYYYTITMCSITVFPPFFVFFFFLLFSSTCVWADGVHVYSMHSL